jgi:hypothetical protein
MEFNLQQELALARKQAWVERLGLQDLEPKEQAQALQRQLVGLNRLSNLAQSVLEKPKK